MLCELYVLVQPPATTARLARPDILASTLYSMAQNVGTCTVTVSAKGALRT